MTRNGPGAFRKPGRWPRGATCPSRILDVCVRIIAEHHEMLQLHARRGTAAFATAQV